MEQEELVLNEEEKKEKISMRDGFSLIIMKYLLECTLSGVVRALSENHELVEIFDRASREMIDQGMLEFVMIQYQQAPNIVLRRHLNESLDLIRKQIDEFMKAIEK